MLEAKKNKIRRIGSIMLIICLLGVIITYFYSFGLSFDIHDFDQMLFLVGLILVIFFNVFVIYTTKDAWFASK